MDIITDPSWSRNMDPDMALSNSTGLNDTMAPGNKCRILRMAWHWWQQNSWIPILPQDAA